MILVQSDSERKLPHHFDAACALYGARETCEDVRLTSFEEIQSGKLNSLLKINTAVGSTEFMTEVFRQLGLNEVRLPYNANRPFEMITLKEAHDRVAKGEKLFIKPYKIKLFTGLVLDGADYSCLRGLPDDTSVLAYKPFKEKILSEWRIYVQRNSMVDARHYAGDLLLAPNRSYVEEVIRENKDQMPVAYTMDIGVLDSKDHQVWGFPNVVIEFNDMWAIGNYGIPNDLYLNLLKDRYREILTYRG